MGYLLTEILDENNLYGQKYYEGEYIINMRMKKIKT